MGAQRSDHMKAKTAEAPGLSADFMSDIHAEWWDGEMFDYAAHKKNDIVIVNGDLASDTRQSIEELKKIAAVYKTVLFVDGNHEFRMGAVKNHDYNFDFDAVEKTLRAGIATIPNVVYLADQPFVQDGVAVIGRNGHWDYKLIEGLPENEAIEDGRRFLKTDFNNAASFSKLARRDYDALRDQVVKFNQDPSIHTIVVVTHTVPRVELLNFSDKFSLSKQAQMGSSLMRTLLQYDANKKVRYWLFGHQHASKHQVIDGVLYHENPRGFKSDGVADYKPSVFTFGPPKA